MNSVIPGDALPVYLVSTVCLATGVLICTRTLVSRMMKGTGQAGQLVSLSPVEMAYLIRSGDMDHCAAVLVVDLIHRTVKNSEGEVVSGDDAPQYKKQILAAVKSYLRTKAEQKAQEIVDWKNVKTPAGIVTGVRKVHIAFTQRLKPFLSELIRDPKHIKRYFNPAGILRMIVDLYAAGIKSSLERDLESKLLSRDLVVSYQTRKRYSNYLWGVSAIGTTLLATILFLAFGQAGWLAGLILVLSLINGALVRTVMAARAFLPFYEEIAVVLDSVKRTGFRVALAKTILKSARLIFWLVLFLVSTLLFSVESLVLWGLAKSAAVTPAGLGVAFLTLSSICAFFIADACHAAIKVHNIPHPTIAGDVAMKTYSKALSKVSPISTISESFSSTEYDDRLSRLVALYGIETLWFLL